MLTIYNSLKNVLNLFIGLCINYLSYYFVTIYTIQIQMTGYF